MAAGSASFQRELLQRKLSDLLTRSETVLPVLILVLVIFLVLRSDRFLTGTNFQSLAVQGAPLAILAFGQTVVVLSRQLDLSVASTMALVSVVTATVALDSGSPWALALAIPIGIGVGIINGTLVGIFKMSSIVVTLGMLVFLRGIANVVAQGRPIFGLPEDYNWLGTTEAAAIPVAFIIAIIVFGAVYAVLKRSTFGLHIYAIGDNPLAARLAGVSIRRTIFFAYVLSGLLAGIAGALLTSRVNTGQARLAEGQEIQVLTAVFLGGIALAGGVGSLAGVFGAVVLLVILANGLNLIGVVSFIQLVISGLILLASIALTEYFAYRHARVQGGRRRGILEMIRVAMQK